MILTKNQLTFEKQINVFCVGHSSDVKWLDNSKIVNTIDEADVVLFPGGSDWNPAIYNENVNDNTYFHNDIDIFQLKCLIEAYYKNKMLIGICRGAQLLGITNGGKLIQHVTNHLRGDHNLHVIGDKKLYRTNSIHHQMVNWYSLAKTESHKNILIGWADNLSTTYENGFNNETLIKDVNNDVTSLKNISYKEPEIFYLGLIKGFGVQGHPEWNMPEQTLKLINKYVRILINRYKNEINPENTIIESRLSTMAQVYPALKDCLTINRDIKALNTKLITKPIAPPQLPLITPSTNITETKTHEENRHSSNKTRVWSDESASNVQ